MKILWLLMASLAWAAEPGIEVSNGAKPGEIKIRNRSAKAVRLADVIRIERLGKDDKWTFSGITLRMISACSPAEKVPPTGKELAPQAEFTPVPWTGYDCLTQCQRPCRMNGWTGPGTFRMVVGSADQKSRWEGPRFALGPAPKRD